MEVDVYKRQHPHHNAQNVRKAPTPNQHQTMFGGHHTFPANTVRRTYSVGGDAALILAIL